MPVPPGRLRLFILVFVLYNLNLRPIPSGDTTPAALLPFSILIDHSIRFDRFQPWYRAHLPSTYFFVRQQDGHFYSFFPITLPLVLTPLYAPLVWIAGVAHWPVGQIVLLARILEKLLASAIAALSVVLLYSLLGRLASRRIAVVLTVVYGLGTETWSISSQALWQHGASELCILASLYALVRFLENAQRSSLAALAGFFAGLAAAVRPTDVVFASACLAYVIWSKWRRIEKLGFALSLVPAPLLALAYNLAVFGHPFGGYEQGVFRSDFWHGLTGLLFSPSRGLFLYTPVFLFVPFGVSCWLRVRRKFTPAIYTISLVFVAGHLLLLSSWAVWWGGYNYGPRLLTDIVPCLTLLLVPAMEAIERSRPMRYSFLAALMLSICIQGVGAFCYPNGYWEARPVPLEEHQERLWDWEDNQILRTVSAGPVVIPYRLAWGLITGRRGLSESLDQSGVRLW